MYLRWAEDHRYKTEIVDRQEGEQAGIKSATVEVDGRSAYGFLRAEKGVHRLVRISPFDAQNRRQTTFALVEVMPEAEDDVEIELDWDEIRVDTYRSQGAGGQHVNKTDSAVRLTHLPTGIVAQSQNERSQTQNKETAIKVLKARLLERALEEKEAALRELKGEHVEAGWGNQIRSYVLHPYQMVKDLRTGQETSNTGAVLDGDLDAFMLAELEREATLDGRRRSGAVDRPPLVTGRLGSLPAALIGTAFRPARSDELAECGRIWREALNDYLGRLNQTEIPAELGPLGRLHAHTQATDPERFLVATVPAPGGERIVAFGSAVVRGPVWFLSMLFVRPEAQGQGLGRALLERLLPGPDHAGPLATSVDSLQPISTALYASYGMAPRMPILDLRGEVSRPEAFPRSRPGSRWCPSSRSPRGHPADPAIGSWPRRSTPSTARCWGPTIPRTIASCAPRVGAGSCTAARTERHSATAMPARSAGSDRSRSATARSSNRSSVTSSPRFPSRGARAVWAPGGAPRLIPTLLAAGLRIDGFPLMLCWDRPFADFARYLPISPGLP